MRATFLLFVVGLSGASSACHPREACSDDSACTDAVACTADVCGVEGCVHSPDHGRCELGTLCVADRGCAAVACSSDADCGDRWYCNGEESCAGVCLPGPIPSCDDSVFCTIDSCDVGADACAHSTDDTRCDDGNACNGLESCSPSGCGSAKPASCSDGDSCTQDLCSAVGCESIPWDLDQDGFLAASSPEGAICSGDDCDDLDGSAHPGAVEDCLTPRDRDCDGDPACHDPDCFGIGPCPAEGCAQGNRCAPARTWDCLEVGGKMDTFFATDGPDSSNVSSCWCGLAGYDASEVVYRIAALPSGGAGATFPEDAIFTLYLYDVTGDLDVFVLQVGAAGECDPSACIAWSATSGTGVEGVAFPARTDSYVVVAGRDGAIGSARFLCGAGG